MCAILMMSAKLANLALLKIKVLWVKRYDVIISVPEVTNKTFSHDSNYIVNDTSVIKGLELKVRMFWGLILTLVKITGENM